MIQININQRQQCLLVNDGQNTTDEIIASAKDISENAVVVMTHIAERGAAIQIIPFPFTRADNSAWPDAEICTCLRRLFRI
jgi:hypothetical protein